MKQKQKSYLFKKGIINLLLVVIGAFCVSQLLQSNQQYIIRERFRTESEEILTRVSETIEKNRMDSEVLTEIYHNLNQSTATDLKKVMLSGLFDYLYTATPRTCARVLNDLSNRSGIDYFFLMDENGIVSAAPDVNMIGRNLTEEGLLSEENLAQLIASGETDCFAKEVNETGSYYFYSDRLNTTHGVYYIVYGTSTDILDLQLSSLVDVERLIENVEIGDSGFLFAVDKSSNSFLYFKDTNGELTGQNTTESGLAEDALIDSYSGEQRINGTKYYCITKDCGDVALVMAATDVEQLYTSGNSSWKWSFAGFVAIALLCILYALIVRNDFLFNDRKEKKITLFRSKEQNYYLNISILKRIFPVVMLGVLFIFGISYYSSTLLAINTAISNASTNINELENNFAGAEVTKDVIKTYYENQYLAKARILANLFEDNPSVLNNERNKQYFTYDAANQKIEVLDAEGNPLLCASASSTLQSFCYDNDIEAIHLYDEQGRMIATSTADWYFELSFDPEDQSYPFRNVLDQKIDYYIQERGTDEAGVTAQYIGTSFTYYTTTDENGNTLYASSYDYEQYKEGTWTGRPITEHKSLLQIRLSSEVMSGILASTDNRYLIENSMVGDTSLLLLDESDEHKVLYSPKTQSIGKTAEDIGLSPNAFNGKYIGFQKVNNVRYLLDVQYYSGYYIGTAMPVSSLYNNRGLMALVTSLVGFFFIMLAALLLIITNDHEESIYASYEEGVDNFSDRIMFMISTPSGQSSITEKALSRWDNRNIPWNERTPEQKLIFMFFTVMSLSIINILLYAIMVSHGHVEDNVISYILSGNWDKGYNVFTLTTCGLILTAAIVAAQILRIPIRLFTAIFGTKSETIGHLLASVIKYATTIYCLFYCLYLVGIDSTSLLTSAGILSLVIGLGSQSLIKDVVAGIFIIFEGAFRVGDIVTIGGYRGQVLDVGLRTTKIMAADNNIKIFNNSEVSGVVNMTRVSSVCSIDVPIAFGIPVSEVEEILMRELPAVKDRVKGILEGPYFRGVETFDTARIVIRISVLCKERNILDVKAGLNREVLDIIYRNSLHKPRN